MGHQIKTIDRSGSWDDSTCVRCQGLTESRTQIVLATPCVRNGLLAIGEAPGADEDLSGEGFIGAAGRTLDRLLLAHGIKREAYGRANICRCRPPENRRPKAKEISSCLPFLVDLISSCEPRVILTIGGTASSVFYGKGTLYSMIESGQAAHWRSSAIQKKAHLVLQQATIVTPYVVPMPHTSPLAFNRVAPSGEKWRDIAVRQIAQAVELLV